MKTIWDIFARDVRRIAGTPKVWIVVIGMMILPALYAWFNIAAFWDPYGNTGNIKIAVVNEDDGADSELTGPLDVGEQLVTQLEQNDQLGWQFMDEAEADDAVHSGDVYASITVPDDFSADVVSLFEAPYSQPTLIYQVNEKVSAVGPQITNQGANAIDQQIISSFCFGPALVIDGELCQVKKKVTYKQRNAIGQLGPLQYVLVSTDGPMEKNSVGLSHQQIAQLMYDLGCINAYNLDGGTSTTMLLNYTKMNGQKALKMRSVGDILYFATAIPSEGEEK